MQAVRNWLNNNKPKGQGSRKDCLSLKLKASASKTPATAGANAGSSNEVPMACLKTNRITLKTFKREDVILGLHGDEIKTQATLKCNGNKSGFAWLNFAMIWQRRRFPPCLWRNCARLITKFRGGMIENFPLLSRPSKYNINVFIQFNPNLYICS